MELLTEVTLQQALHTNIVKETRLLHCPQDIIYTDGSKREMNQFGTVTGSGVYRQAPTVGTAALKLKVHPVGQGMLNTINRAELAAILVAVRECRQYEDECIATDSRCSMQKINKHLRAPAQTKDDCHRPLLQAITNLIVERAKAGLITKIMKVKSHMEYMAMKWLTNWLMKQQRSARKPGISTVTCHKNTASHSRTSSGYSKRSRCPHPQAPQKS